MSPTDGSAFLADCPTRLAVEILSDKWAVLVLYGLSRQPRRHGELVDLIGGISRKVLTQTLRRLTQYGLVEREVLPGHRVQYNLTRLGATLVEPIDVLTSWARDNGDAIVDFQEAANRGGAQSRRNSSVRARAGSGSVTARGRGQSHLDLPGG